ncbi:SbmA/BacA-like family transporter [Alsobacter sp. KACC 23698]|uniref:SbmA/BacA-like family transporter n=1 Tax=Alsobacter sp. KACC 23698 TaxID=3149229 RepID=A0AAU7JGV6_9HYPH
MAVIATETYRLRRRVREPDTQLGLAARYWRSASGFWRGPGAWKAQGLAGLVVCSVILQLSIQYRLNYWGRDFFDAFGRRDGATLQSQALLFLPLAGASLLATVFAVWARMTTQRRWRAWLTGHLIDRWLLHERFRNLTFTVGEDQNPEYRIAEDARAATDAPIALAVGLLNAVLSAIIFIGILWNVGGDLIVEGRGFTLTIPKYLVIAVALYSALLTLAAMVIGRRLVSVIASKNAAEAQFRSVGSHLQERSAALPTAIGRPEQHHALAEALGIVIASWRRVCFQLMRMTMVSQGNILLAPVLAWGLCAPKYLLGSMSLGEVAQVTAAFITVQAALNWFVENYAGLADCMSSVNRVASLLFAFDQLDSDDPVSAGALATPSDMAGK